MQKEQSVSLTAAAMKRITSVIHHSSLIQCVCLKIGCTHSKQYRTSLYRKEKFQKEIWVQLCLTV